MNIKIAGLHLLNGDAFARVKAAVESEGHTLVSAGESAVAALWAEAKAKYPELVAGIKKGIADATDKTTSGGDKAVAVAMDVLETAPAAMARSADAASVRRGATAMAHPAASRISPRTSAIASSSNPTRPT